MDIFIFGQDRTSNPALKRALVSWLYDHRHEGWHVHCAEPEPDREGLPLWTLIGCGLNNIPITTYSAHERLAIMGYPYTDRSHRAWGEWADESGALSHFVQFVCIWNGMDVLTRSRLEIVRSMPRYHLSEWQKGLDQWIIDQKPS